MKTILEIRNSQIKHATKLVKCLRGFTELEHRSVSFRYQKRFESWHQAYQSALSWEKKLKERASNFQEIEFLEKHYAHLKQDRLDKQICI